MERRECPYCREELDEQSAWYLLHWSRGEHDNLEKYTELMNFLQEFEFVSGERKKERFDRVWSHYNYLSMDELLFSPYDFILRPEEVQRLIEFISYPEKKERKVQQSMYENVDSGVNVFIKQSEKPVLPSFVEMPKETARTVYFYQKKNMQDEFDLQGDISIGIQDHVVAKLRRVCAHCHNLTPDDLYHHPIVKVYMMATPQSGKTCMLYSLYLNKNKFHEKNQNHMIWESIQDITVDPYFEKFYQEMRYYEKNKTADPTTVQFIPPLLLKVTYYNNQEKPMSLIVALFDNGGELFLGDANQNAKEHAGLFNQKIKGMDALLCIVNTERSELERDRYNQRLTDEQLDKIRRNSYVLSSVNEQNRKEEDTTEEELTIEDILNGYLERQSNSSTSVEEEIRESSRRIIENLQLRLGGEQEMNEIIKDKYFSLVISKTDRLIHSQLIEEDERRLFFDTTMDYFSEQEIQRKLERDGKMIQWQREGILVQYNLKNFRKANYHFVAAHMQARTGIQPIRIEEPLIGIVEDFLSKGRTRV